MKHMNEFDYALVTGTWEGPMGAAYNATYEFCKDYGWVTDRWVNGEPELTRKGQEALKAYQAGENSKKGDMI